MRSMDTCLVSLAIYLILSAAVLLLNKMVQRYRQAPNDRSQAGEPTESGFAQHNAWNELDSYITRRQRGNPLH